MPKRDADDYRSPVDSYESDVTSADVWSESTLEDSSSQDDSTTGRGKRSSRSGNLFNPIFICKTVATGLFLICVFV